MTATAVASCPCIPDEVFCAWSGCINKLNWLNWCYSVRNSWNADHDWNLQIWKDNFGDFLSNLSICPPVTTNFHPVKRWRFCLFHKELPCSWGLLRKVSRSSGMEPKKEFSSCSKNLWRFCLMSFKSCVRHFSCRPLHDHNSSADWARELLKPSKDVGSLVQKNWILFFVGDLMMGVGLRTFGRVHRALGANPTSHWPNNMHCVLWWTKHIAFLLQRVSWKT